MSEFLRDRYDNQHIPCWLVWLARPRRLSGQRFCH